MATITIGIDDPQYCSLLFGSRRAEYLHPAHAGLRLQCQLGEGITDRAMGNIPSALGLSLQIAEILPPVVADRFRVGQETFVEFFNKCRITAE